MKNPSLGLYTVALGRGLRRPAAVVAPPGTPVVVLPTVLLVVMLVPAPPRAFLSPLDIVLLFRLYRRIYIYNVKKALISCETIISCFEFRTAFLKF